MRFRKLSFIVFILLTIVNGAIFIFRDHFTYQPYADYASLYPAYDEDHTSLSKWEQAKEDYSPDELKEAKSITDTIASDQPTIIRAIGIGGFLCNRFLKQLGNPSSDIRTASPLVQFKKLSADPSKQLWCGNFAQMFSLFCWSQGIVIRTIEIMYPGDHHILNECYVPETKKWMMIDLTNNFIPEKKNEPIDLVAFKQFLAQGKGVAVLPLSNSQQLSRQGAPKQYLGNHPIYYYHYVNDKKAYSTSNKIKCYFLPVSWYDIFDDNRHSNFTFYLKQIFSLLWVVSLIAFVFSRTKFKT